MHRPTRHSSITKSIIGLMSSCDRFLKHPLHSSQKKSALASSRVPTLPRYIDSFYTYESYLLVAMFLTATCPEDRDYVVELKTNAYGLQK